jgi:hypothetical protein
MSDSVNYAKLYGIKSLAGAVVFAVLYVPFFGWFVRQSIRRPTYVFIILSLFCCSECPCFQIVILLPILILIRSSHRCVHITRYLGGA